jgi:hypothetical protein
LFILMRRVLLKIIAAINNVRWWKSLKIFTALVSQYLPWWRTKPR